MDFSLKLFFNKTYENKINESMMYYNFVFPEEEIRNYINELVSISISDFIDYIKTNVAELNLSSKDIFQFSSLKDAIFKITLKLKENNDPGLSHLEIGKLLLDDDIERKYGAYLKYGENHAKTAYELGLLYKSANSYFLSCWGYIWNSLDENVQQKFLLRLISRSNFISYLIKLEKYEINLRNVCDFLSDTTYIRRKSNLKAIIMLLQESKEYDFKSLFSGIIY